MVVAVCRVPGFFGLPRPPVRAVEPVVSAVRSRCPLSGPGVRCPVQVSAVRSRCPLSGPGEGLRRRRCHRRHNGSAITSVSASSRCWERSHRPADLAPPRSISAPRTTTHTPSPVAAALLPRSSAVSLATVTRTALGALPYATTRPASPGVTSGATPMGNCTRQSHRALSLPLRSRSPHPGPPPAGPATSPAARPASRTPG
jgi:hypothetical protein